MFNPLLVAASLCFPPISEPPSMCVCLIRPTTDSALAATFLKTADAVFVGKATSVVDTVLVDTILPSGRFQVWGQRATFDLELGWKSPVARSVIVVTGPANHCWGYRFTPGERYLVFATGNSSRVLRTQSCSPTSLLPTARQFLLGLGEPLVRHVPSDSGW